MIKIRLISMTFRISLLILTKVICDIWYRAGMIQNIWMISGRNEIFVFFSTHMMCGAFPAFTDSVFHPALNWNVSSWSELNCWKYFYTNVSSQSSHMSHCPQYIDCWLVVARRVSPVYWLLTGVGCHVPSNWLVVSWVWLVSLIASINYFHENVNLTSSPTQSNLSTSWHSFRYLAKCWAIHEK